VALALAVVVSGLTNCADEPKPYCLVSPLPFAGRLIQKSQTESTPGACASFGPAGFNADPEVGLAPFYAEDSKGQPDFLNGTVGIRTAEVGALYDNAMAAGIMNTATDGTVYSLGPFASGRPDDSGFCTVPTFSKTHVILSAIPPTPDDPSTPDVDESAPGQDAVDITLEWSNVKIYVTAADYGTQFEGDVVDTRVTPTGDTCTVSYHVLGLSPAVSCNALDSMSNPETNDDGTPKLDVTLCDPNADPAAGRETGSGITVNTNYECDPVTAYCAINGDSIPAIK
jgi:hypothetical protein